MNITTKSKYAIRAVIQLAKAEQKTIRREDLSLAQGGISTEYLEKILLQLRQKQIVTAKTGPGGGYRLAKPASALTAWDVISAVEESPAPVSCLQEKNHLCTVDCEAKPFWQRMWDAAVGEMKKTTIASLAVGSNVLDEIKKSPEVEHLIHQCR